ncbi:prepilin-type N-terminal cleavage/methylation domain-containing protein [Photobacterium profundum]|uniref:prepilin-type N-terminal cleavage/methylation domain-containing protein n=1 Tax=Photobacterium profundum TaxID=74109 RepID=UPI003D098541
MKKQTGFSLVELVIVIIVVGLLSAVALPRFIQITDEAKKSSIKGIAGGYATAALSARAQWEAYGRPADDNSQNVVNYDGTVFSLTKAVANDSVRDGYPFALEASNKSDVNSVDVNDCLDLINNLLQNPPLATTSSSDATNGNYLFYVTVEGSDASKQCRYYQLASAGTNGSGSTDVEAGHSFIYKPAFGQVEVNLQ